MARYFEDKAAIARFQTATDVFIAPHDIKEKIEATFGSLAGTYHEPDPIPLDWTLTLPGDHNRMNAMAATCAARKLGIPDETIKKVLATFQGLPGRLELLGEKNGISFYNDSNATTPDATIAAILTLAPQKVPIILIAGGSDKNLDFTNLATTIKENVARLILFPGKATDALAALLPKDFPVAMADTMPDAFAKALVAATAFSPSRSIIMLSPAATSYGVFKNEYDRAEQFKKEVAMTQPQ
jgi:UDP-N-acetylmuramoylalanine--D-glutamate ligase